MYSYGFYTDLTFNLATVTLDRKSCLGYISKNEIENYIPGREIGWEV